MIPELLLTLWFSAFGSIVLSQVNESTSRSLHRLLALPVGMTSGCLLAIIAFSLGLDHIRLTFLTFVLLCARAGRRKRLNRSSNLVIRPMIEACVFGAGCTAFVFFLNQPLLTFDSFRFVSLGKLLEFDLLDKSSSLLMDYPLAMIQIQSWITYLGGQFAFATPVAGGGMAIASAIKMLGIFEHAKRTSLPLVLGSFLVVVVGSTFMLRAQLAYLNSHLFFSGIVLLAFTLVSHPDSGKLMPQKDFVVAILLATVTVSRVEGLLVASLILASSLGNTFTRNRERIYFGIFVVTLPAIWYLDRARLSSTSTATILSSEKIIAMLLLYTLAVLAFLTLARRRLAQILALFALLALFGIAVGYAFVSQVSFQENFSALIRNMAINGQWGATWWILIPATCALLLKAPPLRHEIAWLTMIFGYFLLIALLGFVREFPYRLGWGDSGNRMLVHLIPLITTYVLAKVLRLHVGLVKSSTEATPNLEK